MWTGRRVALEGPGSEITDLNACRQLSRHPLLMECQGDGVVEGQGAPSFDVARVRRPSRMARICATAGKARKAAGNAGSRMSELGRWEEDGCRKDAGRYAAPCTAYGRRALV